MEDYKIRVNNEAESKEAQELFFELGYEWKYRNIGKNYHSDSSIGFLYADNWCITTGNKDNGYDYFKYRTGEYKELTLPQLRDLVVLKRNDVKDANYRSKSVLDGFYFKSCDGVFYFMFEGKWARSTINTDEGLEPITKDLGLISGAEAKLAWAKGRDVQLSGKTRESDWLLIGDCNLPLNIFEDDDFIFRLKPQTIKLELELPTPFKPRKGEYYFYLHSCREEGYGKGLYEGIGVDQTLMQFGAYRTEEEIKQVVEKLRKIKGAV